MSHQQTPNNTWKHWKHSKPDTPLLYPHLTNWRKQITFNLKRRIIPLLQGSVLVDISHNFFVAFTVLFLKLCVLLTYFYYQISRVISLIYWFLKTLKSFNILIEPVDFLMGSWIFYVRSGTFNGFAVARMRMLEWVMFFFNYHYYRLDSFIINGRKFLI